MKEAEKTTKKLKKKLSMVETRAQEATSRTLVEFCELKEYEVELAEASADAYELIFEDYKRAIDRLHSKLDLNSIQADKILDEEESESEEETDFKEDRPPPS